MENFTHLAELYGFRCYFNAETMEVKGTNKFNDLMIGFLTWMEATFPINDTFSVKIIKELD